MDIFNLNENWVRDTASMLVIELIATSSLLFHCKRVCIPTWCMFIFCDCLCSIYIIDLTPNWLRQRWYVNELIIIMAAKGIDLIQCRSDSVLCLITSFWSSLAQCLSNTDPDPLLHSSRTSLLSRLFKWISLFVFVLLFSVFSFCLHYMSLGFNSFVPTFSFSSCELFRSMYYIAYFILSKSN